MYIIEIENNGVTELLHEMNPRSLRRVSDCEFTDDMDSVDSATITVALQNPAYANLHELTTLVRIINTQTGELEFDGHILQIPEESMDSSGVITKKIICEGVAGYLCDTVQLYHHYEDTEVTEFLASLLDYHNYTMGWYNPERMILLGACTVHGTNSKTTAQRSTMEEIKENLISRLGGILHTRRNSENKIVLDYYKEEDFGTVCDTTVEIAVNMKSISAGTDATGIITRLYPFGCQLNHETGERLTVASVNNGWASIDDEDAIAKYGVKCGTVTFDDITLPQNLLEKGREYLKQACQIKKNFQAVVLDLSTIGKAADSFRAGNTYRFVNHLLNLDEYLRIIRRTVNIFRPYQPTIEIGDKLERVTDIAAQTRKYVEYEIPKQKSEILQQARSNTTALLTNATKGYIYIDNELGELLIMDTPDKTTASKVWRWNSSGFAYSNQGYDDGYFVGMTKDGGIIADRITSGTITGIEFNNGNGTFRVSETGEVTASAINITGGKINISTTDENYDAIVLNCTYGEGNRRAEFTPLGIHVTDFATSVRVQHGGIWGQYYGTTTFSLNSEAGEINAYSVRTGKITADSVLYLREGNWHSLESTITAMQNNIQTLWDKVFG